VRIVLRLLIRLRGFMGGVMIRIVRRTFIVLIRVCFSFLTSCLCRVLIFSQKKQCNGRTQIQSATYHHPAERTPPRSSIRRSSCLAGGSGQCTTTPLTFSTPPLDAGHGPPSSLGRTQPHGEPTQRYFIKVKYGYLEVGTG